MTEVATDSQLSFETPACQDMSLAAEELTMASELLNAVQWSWKSGREDNMCEFSETVIVPVLETVARKRIVGTVIDRGH
jgi:uncharacterized protein YPO0396